MKPDTTHVFDTQIMARHLLAAACFFDCEEGTHPEPDEQSKRNAKLYCDMFVKVAGADLQEVMEHPDYWAHPDCAGHPEGAIGHDLWLTAGGAGVGFWDRDTLPRDLGQRLTEHAERFRNMTERFEQDGDTVYLAAYLEPVHLLITPVGFEDPTRPHVSGEDEKRLRDAFAALKPALHAAGLEKPEQAGMVDALGYLGNSELHLHVAPTGIRGVFSPRDKSLKDWGQLSDDDRTLMLAERNQGVRLVAEAAAGLGLQVQRGNNTYEFREPEVVNKPTQEPVQEPEAKKSADYDGPGL
jgi:hypothetical protein